MKIILNNKDLIKKIRHIKDLGFVPTMGAIHHGHLALIKKSIKSCNKTLVSIFVNPKQFNKKKDFKKYPKKINQDLSILKKFDIDYVYIPKINDIYNYKRSKKIRLNDKDKILCAKYRKGHFEGVLDVMDRLTNLINPKKIFMGKKDFQQFILVKKYINQKYNTKVIGCPIIRDKNKVALSSRNFLLNKNDLHLASKIIKNLFKFKNKFRKSKNINYLLKIKKLELQNKYKIKIEYLENRKVKNFEKIDNFNRSKIFIAYYINQVRLIDNL
tara:strand:- start:978 stop:1790 length:813 start_codon:yes stop_codon:yes gene_type:complete